MFFPRGSRKADYVKRSQYFNVNVSEPEQRDQPRYFIADITLINGGHLLIATI